MLSTHGYFLPEAEVDPEDREKRTGTDQGKGSFRLENPLLRCGLLLAGCNQRGEAKPDDDGIRTSLENVGMNVNCCELVMFTTSAGDCSSGPEASQGADALQRQVERSHQPCGG